MRKHRTHINFINDLPNRIKEDFIILGNFTRLKDKILIKHIESSCKFFVKAKSIIENQYPSIVTCLDKTKYFKYLVNKKLPNINVLEEYTSDNNRIKVEDEKGNIYLSIPHSLLEGHFPSIGTSENNNNYFIKKANLIHNNFYNYDKLTYYKTKNDKVLITCPIHGDFYQLKRSHLSGRGCRKCYFESIDIGWTKTKWINHSKKSKKFDSFKLYIIKCYNDNEEFIKIGRTFTSIVKRFGVEKNKHLPYNYEVIEIIKGEGDYIYDLENIIFREIKEYKYIPNIFFQGINECYNIKVLNNEFIKNIIYEHKQINVCEKSK